MVGFSSSHKGTKTATLPGGMDIWLVEIDSTGKKIWDKTIGGTGHDLPSEGGVKSTLDGGYIVYGDSNSGISGDQTESCRVIKIIG